MSKLILMVVVVGIFSQVPYISNEFKRISTGEKFTISDKVELLLSFGLILLLVAAVVILNKLLNA